MTSPNDPDRQRKGELDQLPLTRRRHIGSCGEASVTVTFVGQPLRLTYPIEKRFDWGKDGGSEPDDRSDRDSDRATRALRPVGHRESSNETPNQLATLRKESACCRVQDLKGNLEVARHELPGAVAPRSVTDRATLRPHAEVTNRLDFRFARAMTFHGSCECERDRFRTGRAVQRHDVARGPLRGCERRRYRVHVREHRRMVWVFLEHDENVHAL